MLHSSCALCSQPAASAVNLGPLLGPIRDAKNPAADELFVHRLCALWSPEVFETDHGTLRNVLAAIKRSRLMKCSHCGRRGATLGCRVPSCTCSYHVACAKDAGCTYYCEQFQVACPGHAPQFKAEARQQMRRTPFTPYRQAAAAGAGRAQAAAGAAAAGPGVTPGGLGDSADLVSPVDLPTFVRRKRGRRQREVEEQILAARAAMKRARRDIAQRRRLEAESSDDDEHFAKKEAARLARDTAKLNAITLVGDGSAVQHTYVKSPAPGKVQGQHKGRGAAAGAGQALPGQPLQPAQAPTQPQQQATVETAVVGSIAATDFSSVAGLDDVVRQLREMVLLPMQYPSLFEGLGLRPPRGILFHGVPGTGKTLVARALAGACAKHSPLPVTFFARKGADCLGKFHGEAERTLRLLFEEASRRAPAIIFLDELDALVPARAARAGGSDQIYASVVSTLLSLMDGVTDRGSVIVVGATNRPEAIDPALRRPGRFDREVYFGLPTPAQRLAILQVHTRRWGRPPPEALLRQVAARTEGYAGADLQALCTAAVMAAVRRSAPLLLELAEQEAGAGLGAAGPGAGGGVHAGAAASMEAADERPQLQQAAAPVQQPQRHQQQQGTQQQQQQQGAEQQQSEGEQQQRQQLLDGIGVQAGDWREALAAAPPPCSRRHGLSALAAEAAAPLQQHELPLVSERLQQLLAALHAADLPLPPPAAAAAGAAAAAAAQAGMQPWEGRAGAAAAAVAGPSAQQPGEPSSTRLESILLKHGALRPAPSCAATAAGEPSPAAAGIAGGGRDRRVARLAALGDEEQQLERLGRSHAPCRLLLWGEGEQGQEAAAGAVLRLFDGCPVHCLSLPSLVAEGGDDAAAGCVALVGEALRRSSPHTPCVFYLPRLEAWALSKAHVRPEEAAGSGFDEALMGSQGGDEEQPPSSHRRASPSFAGPGASPVGASPAHRGFPVATSPFSGLLPLDERVTHTPAVARALRSVTQLHGHHQHEQRLPARRAEQGGEQGAEEGPTLGDLQRRASSLEPHSGGRPPRPAPLAPLLAAPAGLAPIRTSALPLDQAPAAQQQGGRHAQQQARQQARHAAGAAAGAAAAGQAAAAAAAAAGEEGGEAAEGKAEVEVVCLSQAWSVFEALMRQAPATQPIVVLATCHTAPDATPANLVRFFAGPPPSTAAPPASAPHALPAGMQQQARAADAVSVTAASVVRMQPPSQAARQRAAAAAAQHVAAAVSHQAALLLRQQLGAALEAADGRPAAPAGSPAARACTPPQQQEQPPAGPSPGRRGRGQQAQQAQQAAQQDCNTAELEQGLRLFDRLLAFQQQLAAALAREDVAPLHRWAREASARGGRRRAGQAAGPTFADIVQRCRAGGYDSVDALQADAAAAADLVRGLAEDAQRAEQARQAKRGRQAEQPLPEHWLDAQAAVTAACSLQDKADAACFLLRQELSLGEAGNAQLLAAAAAHVRRLQQEEQERREGAEAARRQRDAEAQQVAPETLQTAEVQQEEPGQHPGQRREQSQEAAAQDASAGRRQQEEAGEPGGQAAGPAARGVSPAQGQEAGREGGRDVRAESAPAAATAAAVSEQQQRACMQQQGSGGTTAAGGPAAATAAQQEAHAAEQRRQRHHLACQACVHLRERLAAELLPAVQRRLPLTPNEEGGSAWQVLQEGSGWLSAAAAAACNTVIPAAVGAMPDAQQPSELVAALLAGDAVALEHCATHLAVSCVVAFNLATKADGPGA